ncbi:MAG: SGNH/GDSL hydrolase family protein [Pseudomonadales bacterium]|nr:SGNH/GDSL hydrolase family protein [Pseudomonadales bacterium]
MINTLLMAVLGPVLLGQGIYTRIKTPKLAEPDGPRAGQAGTGSPLRVLILGDSAAAGVGVQRQDDALSGHVVRNLSSDFCVSWQLLARSGLNTGEVKTLLFNTLETNSLEPSTLASPMLERFDVAVLSVGVNDVTGRATDQAWLDQVQSLLETLETTFNVRHVVLAPVPPMHAFPALPQPLRWWLGRRAQQFNAGLTRLVNNNPACTLLPGDFPLDPLMMAEDGFHPGLPIYRLWGQDVAEAIKSWHCQMRIPR